VTFGIARSETIGWGSPGVLGPLAAGVGLLALFGLVEGRLAGDPLIPLGIFRLPLLRAANVIVLLLYAPFSALWFFLSLYMHAALGYDAIQTGLGFLPMTLTIALAALLVPRLVARFGPRVLLTAGLLIGSGGLLLLTRIGAEGSYVSDVLPGGVLAATGLGASLVPGTIVAVQGVPTGQNGLASGLINTARQLGGALGLAILITLAASHTHSQVSSGAGDLSALADGYRLAFAVGAAISLLAALLACVLARRHR
jgi:Na+/melibiose symporter-like transporter